MIFSIYLCLTFCVVSFCLEPRFSERFSEKNSYQLNFTWPIDDVLRLPALGVVLELNSTAFPPDPDGMRWIFTLTSPVNDIQADAKIFLSLRPTQLPSNFSYLLASAKCGILDRDSHAKNVTKTGKNALLTPFSLRFNPFLYRRFLVEDGRLLRAPNDTLVVDCSIDGVLREHMVSRRVRHNGREKSSVYPSRLDLLGQTGQVEMDGSFKFNVTYELDEFEEWPMVYHRQDTRFNGSQRAFHWQFRTHNPSNNHYPLLMWFGFVPNELNSFASSCNCGLMNSNGHKVFGQSVRVNATGSLAFFEFPRFINCDSFESRKPVLMPDGLLRVNCVFEGTFARLTPDKLEGLVERNLEDWSD